MKITIITLAALIAFTSTAQAAYTIIIPMEQAQGGTLPNGSISIKPRIPSLSAEHWQPTEPLYGEWVNVNVIYGCSNWTPATSTQPIGFIFQQTADDCKQDQSSTKQDREQETTTLAYRNVGAPVSTTKTITASSTRTSTGTGTIVIDFKTSASNTLLPSSQASSFVQTTGGWVSANHAHSSEGLVTFQAIPLQAGSILTFFYQTSTEETFDFLKIYVGNVLILSKSGNLSSAKSYTVPTTGSTVIEFKYIKDGNVSAGTDTATVTSLIIEPPK